MKPPLYLLILCILLTSVSSNCAAAVRVEQLIKDLSSESFSAREEATRLFLEQDPEVIPLVRQLLQTTEDAEVKQRAQRILMVLEERDLEARLHAFLNDADEKQGVTLSGWKQFKEVAGSSQEARELFAEMQRNESKLLFLFDTSPDKVPDALAQQLVEQSAYIANPNGARIRTVPKPGSLATYWFLAAQPGIQLGGDDATNLIRLYQIAGMTQRITEQTALRSLFVRWILHEQDPRIMYSNLSYANSLNLPEASILAERIVGSNLSGSMRVSSLGLLIKAKQKAALPILEKALADETVTYQFYPSSSRGERPKEPYKIQFRDLALVQMIGLCGQKPADFGLSVSLPSASNNYLVKYQELILANDEARETLHKKWRAWWDEHKAEFLADKTVPAKS